MRQPPSTPKPSSERDASRNRLDEDWFSEIDNGPSTVEVTPPRSVLYDVHGEPLRRKIGFQ